MQIIKIKKVKLFRNLFTRTIQVDDVSTVVGNNILALRPLVMNISFD